MIKVITFDLWDTLFIDDSDEPKRAAQGLSPKPVARRELVKQFLDMHKPIERDTVDIAYDVVDAAFREVWYSQNVTWTVQTRLGVLLKGLGRDLPPDEMAELVRLHEEMELQVKPDLAPGIAQSIEILAQKYRLGVISDAIFSPGRALRQLLDHYGLLGYFQGFAFSDEIGFAKPAPIVFETICRELDVEPENIVHIGDRELKDIEGPHAVGAKAILTTVVKNRQSEPTNADAICDDYQRLPAIVDTL